jgi:hypothetical protein
MGQERIEGEWNEGPGPLFYAMVGTKMRLLTSWPKQEAFDTP